MADLQETLRLDVEQLTARCDPAWLPFKNTDDLPALDAVFGQERSVRAIEFALGMETPGYNLFASVPDGFGKSPQVLLDRLLQHHHVVHLNHLATHPLTGPFPSARTQPARSR